MDRNRLAKERTVLLTYWLDPSGIKPIGRADLESLIGSYRRIWNHRVWVEPNESETSSDSTGKRSP